MKGRLVPGQPYPKVMVDRLDVEAKAVNSWSDRRRDREDAQANANAAYEAYIWRRPICPIRFVPVPSSWRCTQCGAVDQYERISLAFLWIEVNGTEERETWCQEADVQTRRCLKCMYDDYMEEVPHPPRCEPDRTINLDGTENKESW